MAPRVALLLSFLSLCGCAAVLNEDDALTAIPYRIGRGGHVIVEAYVNHQGPFDFACDTGASISVVLAGIPDVSGLEPLADSYVSIQGLVASGRYPVGIAKSIRVGSESWADSRIAIIPGAVAASMGLDGILGTDFLSHYSVGVAFKDKILRLYDPVLTGDRSYRGWNIVPLKPLRLGEANAVVYTIDLTIGSQIIPALFDLGATSNIMNWRAARALNVRPIRSRSGDQFSGALDSVPVRAELELKQVTTAGIHWRNRTFVIADFPVFGALDLLNRPMAIVGTDIFGGRDLVIDFARNRVLVKVPD